MTDDSEQLSTVGHRLVPHTADIIIEAWGPDRASCMAEALTGLVEEFAAVPDAPSSRVIPLSADPASPDEQLVALLEDVIYTVDVMSVVPVRFHLADTGEGALAGDMEVVPLGSVVVQGSSPKAVSRHALMMGKGHRGWRCRVLIDV